MNKFSSFYVNDDGFTKNLLEQFILLEAKEEDIFNSDLNKKKIMMPTTKILGLLEDSPEKFDKDSKFSPESDSIYPSPETISNVTTLFLMKQVVRNSKGNYNISGGKLVDIRKPSVNVSRDDVISRAKKNNLGFYSVVLKSVKSGTVYEFVGAKTEIVKGFVTEQSVKVQEKLQKERNVKLKTSVAASDSEFQETMATQYIPASEWNRDGYVEAVQGVGAVGDFEPLVEQLIEILTGQDDIFDDVEYEEIYKHPKFRKIVQPIVNAFNTKNASENIAYFKNNNDNFQIMDWIQILSLMLGTSLFSKKVSKFSETHIIHDNKSMTEFRKLTSDKTGDSKTSTVDMVISDVPGNKLLELLKKETPVVNEDGSVKIGSGKFYQISLKATSNAQLGAVKKFIMANYRTLSKEDAAKEIVKESLNESIIKTLSDKMKIGAEKIKSLGSKIFKSVVTLVSNSIKWFKGIIKTIESQANNNKTKYAKELFSGLLIEVEQSYEDIRASYEAMSQDEKIAVCNKAIKKVNSVLKNVESKLGTIKNCGAGIEYISSIIDVAPNTFNSLVGNYAIAKTLESMVSELNEPGKMMKGISDLLAEALLGSSKFPIWIVYGADNELFVEAPKLIKEKSEFTQEKIASFEKNLTESTILFYFRARENSASVNKKNVGSYILNFYTLSDITDDNELSFSLMEYRCDSGNEIIIKATRELTSENFYENILKS
jgi:hypothetical protein